MKNMDDQLMSSSIKNLLDKKKVLQAEGEVRFGIFPERITLLGFIPYHMGPYGFSVANKRIMEIDFNERLVVSPHRIRQNNSETSYPVLKMIKKSNSEIFQYDRHLRIYSMAPEMLQNKVLIQYLNNPSKSLADNLLRSKIISSLFKTNEEGLLQYETKENDYIFTRTYGDYTCIANDFVCLCSYINKISGLPNYSLFDPEDIVKVISEEDESRKSTF